MSLDEPRQGREFLHEKRRKLGLQGKCDSVKKWQASWALPFRRSSCFGNSTRRQIILKTTLLAHHVGTVFNDGTMQSSRWLRLTPPAYQTSEKPNLPFVVTLSVFVELTIALQIAGFVRRRASTASSLDLRRTQP
jgi:hypothetical protein